MASVTCDGREAEGGALPLVLIANFGGGYLISPACTIEDGLDDGPLLFQRVALRQVHVNRKGCYVRGISRSSYGSMMSPGFRSWKSESPIPHS